MSGRLIGRWAWRIAGLLGTGTVLACSASIETKKVPSKTQYGTWTDEDQHKADQIQGFRYYLPRPYIVVKREFAWTSKSIVVPGAVSLDGKYILLDPKTLAAAGVNALPDLAFPLATEGGSVAPAHGAGANPAQGGEATPAPGAEGSALQGNVVKDAGPDAPAGDGGARDGGHDGGGEGGGNGASDGGGGAAASDAASSFAILGSSTDHTVTLSDYMDLLYGPDFDEQYAVKPSGGVSKEDFVMQLGNGWMAESINAHIDNTAIGSFVMDQIGKTLDLARTFTKLIPGVGTALQGAVVTTGAQPTAQKALVKITTVDFVVPGVYPIYKPRELMECVARAQNASGACSLGTPGWGDNVRFHTRADVVIELVGTSPATGGGSAASAGGSSANSATINANLKSAAQDQISGTKSTVTVKNVVGDTSSGVVLVTVACPDPSKSDAVKGQAAKVLMPKVFVKAMSSVKTVKIKCENEA